MLDLFYTTNMITETHNEVSSLPAVILLICKWLSYMSSWIYFILSIKLKAQCQDIILKSNI
jgi:hypothetical protein